MDQQTKINSLINSIPSSLKIAIELLKATKDLERPPGWIIDFKPDFFQCKQDHYQKAIDLLDKKISKLETASRLDILVGRKDISMLQCELQQTPIDERLQWLRAKEEELHGILLYELGMAEFEKNPTEDTLINRTYPLFKTGLFRIKQDVKCLLDNEFPTVWFYNEGYKVKLQRQTLSAFNVSEKFMEDFLEKFETPELHLSNFKTIMGIAEKTLICLPTLQKSLSKPFVNDTDQVRKTFAEQTILEIKQEIAKLESKLSKV